jgi:hypothetical protein
MASPRRMATVGRNHWTRILHWLTARWRSHPSRQLHLRETLTLGERRFIAVVEFERQKFLIAGTGSSVAMLTALPSQRSATENPGPGGREEVPTWAFNGEGSHRQLIRR